MARDELEQQLRDADLRVTRPRLAVLAAVREHPHADTDTLVHAARDELGEVSTQAVYDVLRALATVGLVRRIEPAGSVARYETRTDDNPHHAVCRLCSEGRHLIPKPLRRCRSHVCCVKALCKLRLKLGDAGVLGE